MDEKDENFDASQFDWIELKKDMDKQGGDESQGQKFIRKFKENPLVPIGSILTTICLGVGLYSYRTGQRKMSQTMMRSRVAAQGFTVFALILGLGLGLHGK
ncbi:hypothetical protein HHI36_007547 [Cryptolaemus montrouzieri]|uniref:HIG1 domain-containing protein n=1 Tax=Cryptolaemus montrouzieri TaxID=559131 RepID=A0ABD2MQP8_9CUCU